MSQTWQAKLNKAWENKDKPRRIKTEVPRWALEFEREALTGRFFITAKKLKLTNADLSNEMHNRKAPLGLSTCGRWIKGQIGLKVIKSDKLKTLKVFIDMVEEMERFVEDMDWRSLNKDSMND